MIGFTLAQQAEQERVRAVRAAHASQRRVTLLLEAIDHEFAKWVRGRRQLGRPWTADEVEREMTPWDWRHLARMANVPPPTAGDKAAIVAALRARERDVERAPDPFASFRGQP